MTQPKEVCNTCKKLPMFPFISMTVALLVQDPVKACSFKVNSASKAGNRLNATSDHSGAAGRVIYCACCLYIYLYNKTYRKSFLHQHGVVTASAQQGLTGNHLNLDPLMWPQGIILLTTKKRSNSD